MIYKKNCYKIKNILILFYFAIFSLIIVHDCSAKNYTHEKTEVKISFLDNRFAYIPVTINNENIFMFLDTGSFSSISVNKKIIDFFKIKQTGAIKSFQDGYGNIYHVDEVIFSNVVLGDLKLGNVKGYELGNNNKKKDGVIGKAFFKGFKTIIDLKKEKLILAKTISDLEKMKYFVNKWHKIKCDNSDAGIIFNASVNGKKGKFLLDSGTSHSIIRKTFFNKDNSDSEIEFFKANDFQIKDITYRDMDFVLFNFSQPPGIDGILGIDFFKDKMIFFDLENKIVRIE